ncbi:hypothetical protein BaRGS_00018567 [Batillaria attramentaria]|uniref:Uncharacterized protein n=1 Tax=Batillaria attramentaria TaxID=370345 RepID=A0ABD0KSV7_9CAEN
MISANVTGFRISSSVRRALDSDVVSLTRSPLPNPPNLLTSPTPLGFDGQFDSSRRWPQARTSTQPAATENCEVPYACTSPEALGAQSINWIGIWLLPCSTYHETPFLTRTVIASYEKFTASHPEGDQPTPWQCNFSNKQTTTGLAIDDPLRQANALYRWLPRQLCLHAVRILPSVVCFTRFYYTSSPVYEDVWRAIWPQYSQPQTEAWFTSLRLICSL